MSEKQRPNGVAYWRGTVDSKLESLESKVDEQTEKIDKLITKIDTLVRRQDQDEGKFVEWQWLRDKVTVPLIVGAIIWLAGIIFSFIN